jgi:sugar lactone lactonase YvrE
MNTTTILDRLRFPESTRWRDGRLWLCNWLASEVLAVDPADGSAEVMATVPVPIPFCIDWLPDGRLLVTCGMERRLLAQADDGALEPYADLTGVVAKGAINEVVVDGRGHAFVNGGGYDMIAGEDPAPGPIVCVAPGRRGAGGRRRHPLRQRHGDHP